MKQTGNKEDEVEARNRFRKPPLMGTKNRWIASPWRYDITVWLWSRMNKNDHHFIVPGLLTWLRVTQQSTQIVAALDRFRSASSVQAKCFAALWLPKYRTTIIWIRVFGQSYVVIQYYTVIHAKMDWRTSRCLLDIPILSHCSAKMRPWIWLHSCRRRVDRNLPSKKLLLDPGQARGR